MKHYFRYSRKVKIITFSTLILLSLLSINILSKGVALVTIACIVPCWIVVLITASFSPVYYTRNNDEVLIRLVCTKKRFSLNDYYLDTVSFTSEKPHRVLGSGGLFGYFGWFQHRNLGKFLLFCTSEGNNFIKLKHKIKGNIILIEK